MPDVTATEDTDELFNVEQKTKKNALEYMMSRANKRTFPALKPNDETRRFTKKDELYNEVVKIFREGSIDFPQSQSSSEGDYCVSVITNTMWYITNDHETINTAKIHYSNIGTMGSMTSRGRK